MKVGIRMMPRTSGGGRAYVEKLQSALAEAGGVDSVTVFQMGVPTTQSATVRDAVVLDLPASPLRRRAQGGRALREAIGRHPVDVMLAPGSEMDQTDVPTVLMPLTVAPFERSARAVLGSSSLEQAKWEMRRRSIIRAVRRADGMCFSSHYARGLHTEHVPEISSTPSVVIPPAHTLPDPGTSRPGDSFTFPYALFVSHLYPYKMVGNMIEGFAHAVARADLPHHLVVAGGAVNRAYFAEVQAIARRTGMEDRVHFLGDVPRPQLPGLYEAADLFVFPSLSENAGSFALIDAFMLGAPVLSSSTSSMPEACQDAARYFDPREPTQMADQMIEILTNHRLRADLARRSAERGAAVISWADVGDRLAVFLAQVAQSQGQA